MSVDVYSLNSGDHIQVDDNFGIFDSIKGKPFESYRSPENQLTGEVLVNFHYYRRHSEKSLRQRPQKGSREKTICYYLPIDEDGVAPNISRLS